MSVSWEFYKGRRRINILEWQKRNKIESYSDFIRILDHYNLMHVEKTHPDVIAMGLNKKKKQKTETDTMGVRLRIRREAENNLKASKKEKVETKSYNEKKTQTMYTDSSLLKMKKKEVQNIAKNLGLSLSSDVTKATLIKEILSSQK
jgi:hypothetical protein